MSFSLTFTSFKTCLNNSNRDYAPFRWSLSRFKLGFFINVQSHSAERILAWDAKNCLREGSLYIIKEKISVRFVHTNIFVSQKNKYIFFLKSFHGDKNVKKYVLSLMCTIPFYFASSVCCFVYSYQNRTPSGKS